MQEKKACLDSGVRIMFGKLPQIFSGQNTSETDVCSSPAGMFSCFFTHVNVPFL